MFSFMFSFVFSFVFTFTLSFALSFVLSFVFSFTFSFNVNAAYLCLLGDVHTATEVAVALVRVEEGSGRAGHDVLGSVSACAVPVTLVGVRSVHIGTSCAGRRAD